MWRGDEFNATDGKREAKKPSEMDLEFFRTELSLMYLNMSDANDKETRWKPRSVWAGNVAVADDDDDNIWISHRSESMGKHFAVHTITVYLSGNIVCQALRRRRANENEFNWEAQCRHLKHFVK